MGGIISGKKLFASLHPSGEHKGFAFEMDLNPIDFGVFVLTDYRCETGPSAALSANDNGFSFKIDGGVSIWGGCIGAKLEVISSQISPTDCLTK